MTDGYVHTDDEGSSGGLKAGSIVAGSVKITPLPEPVSLDRDKERWMGMSIGFKSFGTPEQMQELGRRIQRMLSVELHQNVLVINGPYDVDPVWFAAQQDRAQRGREGREGRAPVDGGSGS